ncbi:MAG: glycoside-pentoside-hexuronide (GPH):cation symporter, partial [Pseudomonadales bacterium]
LPACDSSGKLLYAYVTYTLVMLAYTAINVPYSALLAVISPVAEERTKATQYRFVFASLGTLSVGALATPLVNLLGGGDEVLGFRLTIILFAVLSILIFWITFATTRERIKPVLHDSSVKDDLADLVKNISWVILVVSGILLIIGLIARFSSLVYYLKYYVGDDGSPVFLFLDRTAFITSCGLLGQLVGALITPTLTRYFEKHLLVFCMGVMHAVLLGVCYFIPPEAYSWIVVVHSAGVFTFGVIITLLFSMYTDCAQYGEWQTGKQTAGLVVSASMFSLKFGTALGGAIPGFMLAWFGFVANTDLTDLAIEGIRLMFNLVPAVFFAAGGVLMFFYRLNRETVTRIERDLAEQRAQ